MASTAVELLRRRFGGKKEGGSIAHFTKGSFELLQDPSTSYQDIVHSLNSENYIFLMRRKVPVIRQDIFNGAFMIRGSVPTTYSYKSAGSLFNIAGNSFESRTTANYYVGSPANPTQTANNSTKDQIRVYCRNRGYPYKTGVYEWICIDLDGPADASGTITLDENSLYAVVADNLGTTDKVAILTSDTPTLGVACWNSCHNAGNYFGEVLNNETKYFSGFEARVAWADYTSLINNSNTDIVTENTTIFRARTGNPFLAGNYHYKIFKI